ncbi:E3 ubiquitin-protein ligase [Bisporella sp. PMI_857]|nr:E3 ubiquitin-protein ligase [Bisporella sp. PMI_857]
MGRLARRGGRRTGPSRGQDIARAPDRHANNQNGMPSGDQAGQIPDILISWVSNYHSVHEPPRKRQKIERKIGTSKDFEGKQIIAEESRLEHITVNECCWELPYEGSKLSSFSKPLHRDNIKPAIKWWYGVPQAITILDEAHVPVFEALFPDNKDGLEDVLLALETNNIYKKKWSTEQGKIWTEIGISLLERNGLDYVVFHFTIKWNITISPYDIPRVNQKPQFISDILKRYFLDVHAEKLTWSPQDFYQAVHTPSRSDDEWKSLETDQLEANLYPFQKRAVKWLLKREAANSLQNPETSELPISFIKAKDARGRTCFISHLFGLVTLDIGPFREAEQLLKGGILAEEMGLGKTLEIICLMTLHKRSTEASTVFDPWTGQTVRPTAATLIISPPSILQQWISEIKRHAPQLKVMHYEGVRAHKDMNENELIDCLANSNVVISTYAVLAAEIHYTMLNPEKSLRRVSKYPRPRSPLVQLSWWRVCIDEAQMIETGVSNAAVVARLIPRINAWCITGTPVRKDVNDLLGLLIFLRYEPYASTKHVWTSLITSHKFEFRRLFGHLTLRHSKHDVRNELKLPAQRRYIITMPFTPIEEQHYQELFAQMCEDIDFDPEGNSLIDDWEFDDAMAEKMRMWLVRLRQTALHPEIGGRNRRALGYKDGPLRTVDEVLSAMMENTDVSIRGDERKMLSSKLRRGQLLENSPRVREALAIWTGVKHEASSLVEECRELVQLESGKLSAEANDVSKDEDRAVESELSLRLSTLRLRLRSSLEIEHMAVFFIASAYFQIKTNHKNNEATIPDSPEYQALEKLEIEGYEVAKNLRREILQETFKKAEKYMREVSRKASTQSFVSIPEFHTSPPNGGIESRRIMDDLDSLAKILDAQANIIDEWRESIIQFLLRPLVDEDEGLEITGEEYEESTKTQDEVMAFVQALRAVVADRHEVLTGQENYSVKQEVKTALTLAKDGDGPCPEKTIALLRIRAELRPVNTMGSVRGIVAALRALVQTLRIDAEMGNTRAQNELSIVEKQLDITQTQSSKQAKATTGLEKELDLFTTLMNARLDYYRQLQQLSDSVAPLEDSVDQNILPKMLEDEESLSRKIAAAKSKRKYLEHLRMEVENPQEQRICVICRETFEIGALTVCGHQYCKECIRLWWHSHHNCPVCKRKLSQADLHQITYKPQELSIQTEDAHESTQETASPSKSRKSAIYSEVSKAKLAEIKGIELDGPSFTTKVDTLARHLIWLRESDPGAKSIIYSQFKDFLDVLAQAFQRFRIGFSSIDKPNGISRFKNDPAIECFLLHARAHSSGLNLVNASHVFLCEPLLNTALELQAIARVDRIGQHQQTNVWLYLVDGTVEESIHTLSVKRRMEHIDQNSMNNKVKGKGKEVIINELNDKNLEEANSLELQQASLTNLLAKGGKGGEMVENEDLLECLFGGVKQRNTNCDLANDELRLNPEVRRLLGAEAAEGRLIADGSPASSSAANRGP